MAKAVAYEQRLSPGLLRHLRQTTETLQHEAAMLGAVTAYAAGAHPGQRGTPAQGVRDVLPHARPASAVRRCDRLPKPAPPPAVVSVTPLVPSAPKRAYGMKSSAAAVISSRAHRRRKAIERLTRAGDAVRAARIVAQYAERFAAAAAASTGIEPPDPLERFARLRARVAAREAAASGADAAAPGSCASSSADVSSSSPARPPGDALLLPRRRLRRKTAISPRDAG